MKNLFFLFVFLPFLSFGQLNGEIVADQRKISSNIDYTMKGTQSGKFVFDISVNVNGNITSCVLRKTESTIVNTPLMMKAKNMIIAGLKFESGNRFPTFHLGVVTITVIKE